LLFPDPEDMRGELINTIQKSIKFSNSLVVGFGCKSRERSLTVGAIDCFLSLEHI